VSLATVPVPGDLVAAAVGLRSGRPVVLVDDLRVEPSVVLVGAAEAATPALVVELLRHSTGLLGVTVAPERLVDLGVPLWSATSGRTVARSVAVIGPGDRGSVAARAATLRALAGADASPRQFTSPGCAFPLPTEPAALLSDPRPADLAAALVGLAGGPPVAVCAPALDEGGIDVAPGGAATWAASQGFDVVWASDVLAEHCRRHPIVTREASARLPTAIDPSFRVAAYSRLDGSSHVALAVGRLSAGSRALAIDECGFGPFRPRSCRCHARLDRALRTVASAGAGLVVYLRAGGGRCPETGGGAPAHRSVAGIVRAFTIAAIHEDQVLVQPPETVSRRQPC
jgi:3,4-dihydroxy 2-butanone 4-phosphate synthase/GTP cyclohydrolase II